VGKPLEYNPSETLSNRELQVFEMIGHELLLPHGLPSHKELPLRGRARNYVMVVGGDQRRGPHLPNYRHPSENAA